MKLTKEDLLAKVREHGGDEPDDFIIALLEDITDSFEEFDTTALVEAEQKVTDLTKTNEDLTVKYNALKKSYSDRFVIKDGGDETGSEDKTDPEETTEDYSSIF